MEQRGAGRIFDSVAVALPPLAVFAPLALAPLIGVMALALLATDRQRCLAGLGGIVPLAGLLAALTLWGALSASWSILPEHSLVEALRFLGVSAAGLIVLGGALALPSAERPRLARAVAIGIALAILLLLIERFSDAGLTRLALGRSAASISLTRFDRGTTVVVLSVWAALTGAEVGHRRRAVLIVAVPATALVMLSTTAFLAIIIGLGVFVVARFLPRLVAAALILGVVAVALGLPLAAPSQQAVVALHAEAPWLKDSALHRLLIWRFAADRVAERPLLGWGMDASRDLPGGHQQFAPLLPQLHLPANAPALPLHPHDALLQWQVELGVPGLILGLAIILWTIHRIGWRAPLAPWRRAGALAYAVAALLVGLLSFGIWQEWWLACLWLTAALYAGTASDAG